jgi:hypothetical protein
MVAQRAEWPIDDVQPAAAAVFFLINKKKRRCKHDKLVQRDHSIHCLDLTTGRGEKTKLLAGMS